MSEPLDTRVARLSGGLRVVTQADPAMSWMVRMVLPVRSPTVQMPFRGYSTRTTLPEPGRRLASPLPRRKSVTCFTLG